MSDEKRLSEHQVREIAVVAECHPRTVARFLSGGSVRELSERRIRRALDQLGIEMPGAAA